jgi:hypothetical protein
LDDRRLLEFDQHRPQLVDQLRDAPVVLIDLPAEGPSHGFDKRSAGEVDPEDDNAKARKSHIKQTRRKLRAPGIKLTEIERCTWDTS